MKLIKIILSFFILVSIGLMISYADSKLQKNEYNQILNTFEEIGANFKFYNIKSNCFINKDISKEEITDICMELITNMGLEENNLLWQENWDGEHKQIYIQSKDGNSMFSIVATKKNEKESYIIVDILDNKVYKNIVGIYTILENTLSKYSTQVDTNLCICGEYYKKIQFTKHNDIFDKILYNMNAREIDRIENDNFVSLTAYSEKLNNNSLYILGDKINLNIGMRYSEDEDKTLVYIATPIIKLDY